MKIESLLKQSESKTLEFKENLDSKDKILHTIVAFTNTAGGKLVVGITDKERLVVGIQNPHLMEEKLANLISDSIVPQIVPNIEIISWKDKYIMIADIYPGPLKPYYLKNKGIEHSAYIRVGSTNRVADQEMLSVLARSGKVKTFDEDVIYEEESEAIDFRVASELFKPHRDLTDKDLYSLGILVKEGSKSCISKGGMILFGKKRYKYFPDSWIQVGRFQGLNKAYILDSQEIKELLPIAIDEVFNFLRKHLLTQVSIEYIKNEEIWSVPKVAIREAVINAIVHADYSITGGPIRILVFDDRVEIESPGLLAIGITVEDIVSGISKIRNRIIARVFQELRLIEQWGSGIQRMLSSCKEIGIAEPKFEEIGTRFRVTFFRQKVHPILLDDIENKIIMLIKENGQLSTAEIANLVDLSARAIRTRLISMIKKGKIYEISRHKNDPKKKYALIN